MKEKTKNILRIVLNILDTILHLFIKKQDTPSQNPENSCHPEQSEGSEANTDGRP